jgi:hypothetical protein
LDYNAQAYISPDQPSGTFGLRTVRLEQILIVILANNSTVELIIERISQPPS